MATQPILTRVDLGVTGIAALARYDVYLLGSYATPFTTRAPGGTIAQVGASATPPKTLYYDTFLGDPGATYDICWNDGSGNMIWTVVNPGVGVRAVGGVAARDQSGTATVLDALHITLDSTDFRFGRNNAGLVITLLRAAAGAGQYAVIASSNTTTGQQTLVGGWNDGATVTGPADYLIEGMVPTTLSSLNFGKGVVVTASSATTFTASSDPASPLNVLANSYTNGTFLRFDSGVLATLKQPVTAHTAAGSVHTFTTAGFPQPPGPGDRFTLV